MEKQKELLEHLKQNHTGRDKAVCSKELERLFSLNGRTIRRIISSLRQDGNPICSNGKGYYFARTQDEINETVSRLNGLVTGVSNARTGLLYAKIVPDTAVEIVIRFGGSIA